MTPGQFLSAQQQQDRRDVALLHKPGSRLLPPDGYGVLTAALHDPLFGTFPAGTVVEVCGSTVRLCSGRLAVRLDAAAVEPYTPEDVDMVVSPFTRQLIPARGQTARRYAVKETEMVR